MDLEVGSRKLDNERFTFSEAVSKTCKEPITEFFTGVRSAPVEVT